MFAHPQPVQSHYARRSNVAYGVGKITPLPFEIDDHPLRVFSARIAAARDGTSLSAARDMLLSLVQVKVRAGLASTESNLRSCLLGGEADQSTVGFGGSQPANP